MKKGADPKSKHKIVVYDAGGGRGKKNLKFDVLSKEQHDMYKRTLKLDPLVLKNRDQEHRQLKILAIVDHVRVHISREDNPSVGSFFLIDYTNDASQEAWGRLLLDVRVKLGLEYIHSIIDRKDMSPVHRTLKLRNGGLYFVRPTENSSILEVLTKPSSSSNSIDVNLSHWPVVRSINGAIDHLRYGEIVMPEIHKRVDTNIMKPRTRLTETSTAKALLSGETPESILHVMTHVLNGNMECIERQECQCSENTTMKELDKEVDIVGLHRLALESLNRLAINGQGAEIAKSCMTFISETIKLFESEVDIVTMGLKLVADLNEFVVGSKNILHLILNCVQSYAPQAPVYRKRNIKRIGKNNMAVQAHHIPDDLESKNELVVSKDEDTINDAMEKDVILTEENDFITDNSIEMKKSEEFPGSTSHFQKKRWTGTKGTIGAKRKPVVEAVVDFSSFLAKDDEVDEVVEIQSKLPGKAIEQIVEGVKDNTPSLSLVQYPPQSENVGKGKPKKPEQIPLRPLPAVPGVTFRGLVGNMKMGFALLQAFNTLFKLIQLEFKTRLMAFELFVHEEIAEVALVCQSKPRVLDYIVWIINAMYTDGFEPDYLNANIAENSTVQLIENDGDMKEEMQKQKPKIQLKKQENISKLERLRKNVNSEVLGRVGESAYSFLYLSRPSDSIILSLSLIATSCDIDAKERALANQWLDTWDDNTFQYETLRKKGKDIGAV